MKRTLTTALAALAVAAPTASADEDIKVFKITSEGSGFVDLTERADADRLNTRHDVDWKIVAPEVFIARDNDTDRVVIGDEDYVNRARGTANVQSTRILTQSGTQAAVCRGQGTTDIRLPYVGSAFFEGTSNGMGIRFAMDGTAPLPATCNGLWSDQNRIDVGYLFDHLVFDHDFFVPFDQNRTVIPMQADEDQRSGCLQQRGWTKELCNSNWNGTVTIEYVREGSRRELEQKIDTPGNTAEQILQEQMPTPPGLEQPPADLSALSDPPAATGPACVVPKVAGMKEKAARAKLKRAGCGVQVRRIRHSKSKKGYVIKSSTKPGKRLKKGYVVSMTVSRGKR